MVALVYMTLVSVGSFIFLMRIRYLRLLDLEEFHNNLGDAKDLAEFVIIAFALIVDFIRDTLKYILIACAIALVSLVPHQVKDVG